MAERIGPQDQDAVRRRAHEIWERAGRPDGQEEAHWAQAEEDLRLGRDRVFKPMQGIIPNDRDAPNGGGDTTISSGGSGNGRTL